MSSPSPEHRLAALLAGTSARRQSRRADIEALAGEVDLPRLADYLAAHRLLALLGQRLMEAVPATVDAATGERIRTRLEDGRRISLATEMLTLRLSEVLDRRGVEATVLKGPFMARQLHGDPGVRSSNDIDLLVGREKYGQAIAALTDDGYVLVTRGDWRDGLPLFEDTLVHADRVAPRIDLHWRLHWYENDYSAAALRRAVPVDEGPTRCLAPLDLLVALLLYHARDGFWGIRTLTDIAAWWDRFAPELPEDGLEGVVAAAPALEHPLRGAAVQADRLVGVPLARLFPSGVQLSRPEVLAQRLANWDESIDVRRFPAVTALVDMLISPPRQRARALARYYSPPSSVVARAYDTEPGGRVSMALLHARYTAMVTKKYLGTELVLLVRARRSRPAVEVP